MNLVNDNEMYKPSVVARLLGVSRSTIYRWFWEDRLQGIKYPVRALRISGVSINRLVNQSDSM